jgi:hypothetical protein
MLGNFEELAQSPSPSMATRSSRFYRGTSQKDLPVEFVSASSNREKPFTKVTAWCVEPLFRDMQPTFDKILNSYRSTG